MTEKYSVPSIMASVKSEREAYQAKMETHVSALREERKNLEVQLKDLDALIEEITGKAPSSSGSGKRIKLDDAAVLAFIGKGEKTAGDVEKEFGCSYVTATKKLKALEKSKKLVSAKDGNKTLYKVK